jgi:protein arginine kinase activator
VISQTRKPAAKSVAKMCPGCGLNFSQFRQTGRLGCAECYQVFETELGGLVERAQNGGSHHTGKSPKRAGTSIDRQLLIQRLVRELDHAVAAEQYERAAELRDRLHNMDAEGRTPEVRSQRSEVSRQQPDA